MRNCIVLGCGRSGTSLVAGLLRDAGYRFGPDQLEPDASNPTGYYESGEVNGVNEAILAEASLPWWLRPLSDRIGFRDAGDGLRWLNRIPTHWLLRADESEREAMHRLTREEPFCFKDPRFCYTLPCWAEVLRDPVVLYVVRHPLGVARSLVEHARRRGYAERLGLDFEDALAVWRATNRYVLTRCYGGVGDWHVVRFRDCLAGPGVEVVEAALGVEAAREHVDPAAPREDYPEPVPESCRALHRVLEELAERALRSP